MKTNLRRSVSDRAGNRCEYCRVHQDDELFYRHHVEHIIAVQHGGQTIEDNLALSCFHCNSHKGPNLTGIDPETSQIVPLFHPRRQVWAEHFAWRGAYIAGISPTGRATVRVLAINEKRRLRLRALARNPS